MWLITKIHLEPSLVISQKTQVEGKCRIKKGQKIMLDMLRFTSKIQTLVVYISKNVHFFIC